MLPEEIKNTADAIVEAVHQAKSIPTTQDVKVFARATLERLASQIPEEAARMACERCLNGLCVERRSDGDYYHPSQRYWPETRCAAGGIYALKDSLVQETSTAR